MPMRAWLTLALVLPIAFALGCVRTVPSPVRAATLSSIGSEEALDSLIQGIARRRAEAQRNATRTRLERAAAMATVPAPSTECRGLAQMTRRSRLSATVPDSAREAVIVASARGEWSSAAMGARAGIWVTGPTILSRLDGPDFSTLRLRLSNAVDTARVEASRIGFGRQGITLQLTAGDSLEVVFELCGITTMLNQVVTTGTRGEPESSGLLEGPSSLSSESITNVQHAGVDEGGIVKRIGAYLVILRQGRLYSVRVADSALHAVATHAAAPPGAAKGGVWLDEMLTFENQILVIGYNYSVSASEVTRFLLRDDGEFEWLETQHFRSNDYYSRKNYASRLIDGELMFYTPIYGIGWARNPGQLLPRMRRWSPDRVHKWERTARSQDIYATRALREYPDEASLHVVTRCALRNMPLQCRSIAVLAAGGEEFYVSPRHVYVWTAASAPRRSADSLGLLFRMPHDGSAPAAVRVRGMPIDQLSFFEDSAGALHVLTNPSRARWWMDPSGQAQRELALVRIPSELFGDGEVAAPPASYRRLAPALTSDVHARFMRDRLVIGFGSGWGQSLTLSAAKLQVVPLDGGPVTHVRVGHGVERVEAMGSRALAIGEGMGALLFSAIDLDARPQVRFQARLDAVSEGESRTHAFFYHAEGADRGILGIPVRQLRSVPWAELFDSSMRIALLRNEGDRLVPAGGLQAGLTNKRPPECVTSCIDWYGNSRPLFLDGRILALLGDEIVEGVNRNGEVVELRRIQLAPRMRLPEP